MPVGGEEGEGRGGGAAGSEMVVRVMVDELASFFPERNGSTEVCVCCFQITFLDISIESFHG